MPTTQTKWKFGQRSELAQRAGLRAQYLNDVLHRRKSAGAKNAKTLAAAAAAMGLPFTRLDFLYPEESLNPLMRGEREGSSDEQI